MIGVLYSCKSLSNKPLDLSTFEDTIDTGTNTVDDSDSGSSGVTESGQDSGSDFNSGQDSGSDSGEVESTEDVVCENGQVYVHHPCVPTLELGCNEPCDGTCDDPNYICDPCGASSTASTPDCQPACVLAYAPHAPVVEPLRISPTIGMADTEQEISIQGTPFYIGALGHNIRFDDQVLPWPYGGSFCTATVTLPSKPTGVYPVYVSQYSGGESWVLAGFYHSGMTAQCQQPGAICSTGDTCCSTSTALTSCQSGYCMPL